MTEAQITLRSFVQLEYKTPANTCFFVGKTAEEAQAELDKWLVWTTNRSSSIDVSILPLKEKGFNQETLNPQIKTEKVGEMSAGKGHSLIGKVWMIHHKDHLRARVLPSEVSSYEAKGFVRGGPKTSFRG